MPQIPSPFEGKKPDLVDKKTNKAFYGTTREEQIVEYVPNNPENPTAGVHPERKTIQVPQEGETIDLETGQSDSKYWQPEKVLDPTGCVHVFEITNLGKREIECQKCTLPTNFHPGINYFEENGKSFIVLKGIRFLIDTNTYKI